jgi:tetratricopeptide (TPR) repeat protein
MDGESGKDRIRLARAAFEKALRIDPEYGQVWRSLSGLAYQEEKYDLATTYATKALTCKEKDLSALWDRARAYASLHKNKEALADITEMINRYPRRQLEHYVLKAQILESLGKIDETIATYREASHWGKDWASFQIINCLARHNRIDEAMVEATSLIKANPEDDEAFYARAKLEVKKKDFQHALADYSKAISLEPLSKYYRERASAYKALGQNEMFERDMAQSNKWVGRSAHY